VRAIVATDQKAGPEGLTLTDLPYPAADNNEVVVQVCAASMTPGELTWPSTWTDRAGTARTVSVPGHEVSGVVAELGYGTTGLSVGQRVFGLTDWSRNGSLAEYVAVEARNLAPLPANVEHEVAVAAAISGLTAWQALHVHARPEAGQTILIHGVAGAVGYLAAQLARELGAEVIGTGRARDREVVAGLRAFVDPAGQELTDVRQVDVVFDVLGGDVLDASAALVRPGGTLVTITEPPRILPSDGRGIFFVVEPDRAQLTEIAHRLGDGRLAPRIGAVHPLAAAAAAFGPEAPRGRGKTIIRVR
jgi:NADPH:quinone reductase-like Zn-dependent oxidoreductase